MNKNELWVNQFRKKIRCQRTFVRHLLNAICKIPIKMKPNDTLVDTGKSVRMSTFFQHNSFKFKWLFSILLLIALPLHFRSSINFEIFFFSNIENKWMLLTCFGWCWISLVFGIFSTAIVCVCVCLCVICGFCSLGR